MTLTPTPHFITHTHTHISFYHTHSSFYHTHTAHFITHTLKKKKQRFDRNKTKAVTLRGNKLTWSSFPRLQSAGLTVVSIVRCQLRLILILQPVTHAMHPPAQQASCYWGLGGVHGGITVCHKQNTRPVYTRIQVRVALFFSIRNFYIF